MTLHIRKIESREEYERKTKRNTLILSMIMIGILVFSTAGYFSLGQNNDATTSGENGVIDNGGSWTLQYGGQNFRITNSPGKGQNVSMLTSVNLERYYGQTVYVSTENDAEFYEIYSTLGAFTGRMQQACYGECYKDLPEKDCTENMIVIKSLNESEDQKNNNGKIYESDNCLFIEGSMTAIDAFLYRIFGVN